MQTEKFYLRKDQMNVEGRGRGKAAPRRGPGDGAPLERREGEIAKV